MAKGTVSLGKVTFPRKVPMMFRIFDHKNDPVSAIYFVQKISLSSECLRAVLRWRTGDHSRFLGQPRAAQSRYIFGARTSFTQALLTLAS